jgi:hypothetical protein
VGERNGYLYSINFSIQEYDLTLNFLKTYFIIYNYLHIDPTYLLLTLILVKIIFCWASVAHACNPSYLGGRDQEERGSKPACANSL